MIIGDVSIERLIPHRDRMKLAGRIIDVGETFAVTESIAAPEWPLVRDGHVHPIIMIELTAQTAGVWRGWTALEKRGEEAAYKGWLVGIKSARFFVDRIPLGAAVRTRAENSFAMDNFIEISGTIEMNERPVGAVVLQVFGSE